MDSFKHQLAMFSTLVPATNLSPVVSIKDSFLAIFFKVISNLTEDYQNSESSGRLIAL